MLTPIYAHLENTSLCTLLLSIPSQHIPTAIMCTFTAVLYTEPQPIQIHAHICPMPTLPNAYTVDLAIAGANVHVYHALSKHIHPFCLGNVVRQDWNHWFTCGRINNHGLSLSLSLSLSELYSLDTQQVNSGGLNEKNCDEKVLCIRSWLLQFVEVELYRIVSHLRKHNLLSRHKEWIHS